jgi:membrane protein YdbS with pleckstrin-like domain
MAITATPALPLRPPAHQLSPRAVRWWQLRALLTLVVLVAPQVVVLLVLGSRAPGWLVREWRIAPISRVQTVDTEHGPLQQLLKLASVTVTTASARGPVKISGLEAQAAAELARTLTETTQATPGDAT